MEKDYINRYYSFCNCLEDFTDAKNKDLTDSFILSGVVQKFSLTFDISWKVMKDILIQHYGILDFAVGSPRETLKTAFSVNLISDDVWMDMLKIRNELTHDYNKNLAETYVCRIVNEFIDIFWQLRNRIETLLPEMEEECR